MGKTRDTVATVLMGSLLGAGACAHKPPEVTPQGAASQSVPARDARLGPLFFDPQGADFTTWINHFRNVVYRNWLLPQGALHGAAGHVEFEMTVERDGSLSALRLLQSTASPILDEAAQNALSNSVLAALPEAYAGARLTMQLTFFYNETPR